MSSSVFKFGREQTSFQAARFRPVVVGHESPQSSRVFVICKSGQGVRGWRIRRRKRRRSRRIRGCPRVDYWCVRPVDWLELKGRLERRSRRERWHILILLRPYLEATFVAGWRI